jgi:hypothetical protein
MTKEQEYLEVLEKEQIDYIHALGWLARQSDLDQRAKTAIRKAIDIDMECIESEIRALKKKGVNNEQPCEDTQEGQTADVSQM